MTTRTRIRNGALGAAAAALLVTGGVLIGQQQDDEVRPASAPTAPARIEATPVPGTTIERSKLDHNERYYLDSVRAWTSSAMDTAYWTDEQLLDYAHGTCAALAAEQSPGGYALRMDTLVPHTGAQTPLDDRTYAEAAAAQTWCPDYVLVHSDLRH